jgi:hypothetical protein
LLTALPRIDFAKTSAASAISGLPVTLQKLQLAVLPDHIWRG